ncbi:MAG: hypothetical protein EP344_08470, partial [Bacteroidetes bacterium]
TLIPAGSTQQFVLQNYLGCDSVLTVSVMGLPPAASTLQIQLCPGDTFPYQGSILQIGDSQAFTLQSMAGCDSVVTVVVSGLPSTSETIAVEICPGTFYRFDGVDILPGETLEFTYANSQGCDSTILVSVGAFPDVVFDLGVQASCANSGTGQLTVENPAGGLQPFQYSLDGTSFQQELTFSGLLPGDYTVWLEDANGCLFEGAAAVPALEPLVVELNAVPLPCDSGGVLLAPLVGGDQTALNYQWSTGQQIPAITVYNPGMYWVEVRNSCDVLKREVEVNWADSDAAPSFVYLPNVFAPLSTDPDNARFHPHFASGLRLLNYKLEVYDRWGNLMFRSRDTDEGWTGPFRDHDMQPAVFVWLLSVDIDYCGRIRHLRLEGDVTVVR